MSPSAAKHIIKTDDERPLYGRRLLPILLDDLARNAPSRIYASIPTSQSYSTGVTDISMAAFARAVDRCSWWLEEQLGRAVDFPTIAYLGPSLWTRLLYFRLRLTETLSRHQIQYTCDSSHQDTVQGETEWPPGLCYFISDMDI